MTDPSFYTWQQAQDPTTPPEVLTAMADQRPDLRAAVAGNPSTPAAVLQWLGQLGDPAVAAALGSRPGFGPGPPGGQFSGPPPVAGGAPGAAGPGPGASAGKSRAWIYAVLTGIAVAIIGGGGAYWALSASDGSDNQAQPAASASPSPGGSGATPSPAGTKATKESGPAPADQAAPVPGTYGSDATLDFLWDACADGDMVACDDLYRQAPVGSGYEAFGDTCGYRQGGGQWCDAGAVPASANTYGDDPVLDGLWDACAAGDMLACDDLYTRAPAGSEYEWYGDSCGWRTNGADWCYTAATVAPYTYGDDSALDWMWDMCAIGDWASCDQLYVDSPAGSEYERFGDTCGYLTAGGTWCS